MIPRLRVTPIASIFLMVGVAVILGGCGSSSGSTSSSSSASGTPGKTSATFTTSPSATATYQSASQLVDDLSLAGVQCTEYAPVDSGSGAIDAGGCNLDGGPAQVSVNTSGGRSGPGSTLSSWIAMQTTICPSTGVNGSGRIYAVIGADWSVATASATDQARIAAALHGQPETLPCG